MKLNSLVYLFWFQASIDDGGFPAWPGLGAKGDNSNRLRHSHACQSVGKRDFPQIPTVWRPWLRGRRMFNTCRAWLVVSPGVDLADAWPNFLFYRSESSRRVLRT
jgi:hypothetical protein